MRRLLALSALLLTLAGLEAKTRETYDITSFAPPKGWKKETADFAVSYVVTNNKTGS